MSHAQSLASTEPAADVENGVQAVHAALPVVFLKVFGSHAKHWPPSGPVWPTLHVQAVTAALPAGEKLCVGHC